ncbi:hypothetical protein Gotri_004822 [Gossypium trilobum]|uniref:Uncharacterized protein n=1 Tax=Gossypium trilobum TaxID=34281 RepID=A0A7J9F638_9ROSI|nr:hypothetical protein [Gossypium trilobum]
MMEIIKLKPSFARKLNQGGFSPLHLALQNDKIQAVHRLLRFDKGLVRVKGREDLTPLHLVVQTGNVDLLIKLLKVCPEAIGDVTVRDETVFHLAVKNDMVEAFQVMVGWLTRSSLESADRWEEKLLSWPDIDGNTVLHIAAIRNRPRMVEVLLEHMRRDQINAKNLEGLTALDIQSQYPWNERQADRIIGRTKGMSHETRNTFLVLTVLIITSTYEACLNPPKMPDDSPCPSLKYQVSLSQDQPLNSHTFLHKTDMNTAPMPSPSAMDVSEKVDLVEESSSFWCSFISLGTLCLDVLLCKPNRLLKLSSDESGGRSIL